MFPKFPISPPAAAPPGLLHYLVTYAANFPTGPAQLYKLDYQARDVAHARRLFLHEMNRNQESEPLPFSWSFLDACLTPGRND